MMKSTDTTQFTEQSMLKTRTIGTQTTSRQLFFYTEKQKAIRKELKRKNAEELDDIDQTFHQRYLINVSSMEHYKAIAVVRTRFSDGFLSFKV